MIFGELLTSSNYDDDEKRTTGGRNGYGSKLVNIFSTKFIVEIVDAKRKKKFISFFAISAAPDHAFFAESGFRYRSSFSGSWEGKYF